MGEILDLEFLKAKKDEVILRRAVELLNSLDSETLERAYDSLKKFQPERTYFNH